MDKYIPRPGDKIMGTITRVSAVVLEHAYDNHWRVEALRDGKRIKEIWNVGVMRLAVRPKCQFCNSPVEQSGKYIVCTECYRVQEE